MQTVNTPPRLAIVVPCYNEEAVLKETNTRLTSLLNDLAGKSKVSTDSYIVYVDDGSKDATWEIISRFQQESQQVRGVKLAHNAGHQNALMAGIETFKDKADAMVTIDADLQDDVNAIEGMIDAYLGGSDVVYGVRKERTTDTFFKRTTALVFYKMMAVMGTDTVYNHADYRLMSKRAIQALCQYPERNLFLRGLVPLLGFNTQKVYYDRAERFAGESKYPLNKMLAFAIDGITSFSIKPITVILVTGFICFVIGILMLLWGLYSYFWGTAVPGWTSLMVSLWLISGVVIMSLGVIGEYIGKIYIEVKQRPRYHIQEVV
jgi:glycosyltransferase involved in cell wall biosynthesis